MTTDSRGDSRERRRRALDASNTPNTRFRSAVVAPLEMGTLVLMVAGVLAVRLALAAAVPAVYGYHRDELLYFAMGEHLSWWRMQFPPLVPFIARVSTALFGETSVWSARVPAACGATALAAAVVCIVRRSGGGRLAAVLACAALFAGPIYMRSALLFQPVVFDQLWYAVAALGMVYVIQNPPRTTDNHRGWIIIGIALGLGALTKFSVAFYAFAVLFTILLLPELRASLRGRWPYVAALVSVIVASGSIAGQIANDWPFLQQTRSLRESQLATVSPLDFLAEQPLLNGGATLLVIAGIGGVFALRELRGLRALPLASAIIGVTLLVLHGKGYYAAPAYPPLIALGATTLERIAARATRRWIPYATLALMLAVGIALLPAGYPVLAPLPMARYAGALGLTETNTGGTSALPQDYADMIGWPSLAESAAAAWRALPDPVRDSTVIVGASYGRAGALLRYRGVYGLPAPVSPFGDFWAWGPGPPSAVHMLVVGAGVDDVSRLCGSTQPLAPHRNPLGVAEERIVPITMCLRLRQPLRDIWPTLGPRWG